jgi:hypothetical protein
MSVTVLRLWSILLHVVAVAGGIGLAFFLFHAVS